MITTETKTFSGIEGKIKEVVYINEMISNGYSLVAVVYVNFNFKYYWLK